MHHRAQPFEDIYADPNLVIKSPQFECEQLANRQSVFSFLCSLISYPSTKPVLSKPSAHTQLSLKIGANAVKVLY